MAGVIVVSEILVASVETTGEELGFGQLFVGAIIVGIVGNAAEHSSAILLARKGKMELSIGIASRLRHPDSAFCSPDSSICRHCNGPAIYACVYTVRACYNFPRSDNSEPDSARREK